MDILMVSAELSPYARETPAADSVASLTKTLRQVGHDVTLALPRYPGFEAQGLLVARRLSPLVLDDGAEFSVFDGQLPSGARLVLFDAADSFQRAGVFGEEGKEYSDNAKRMSLFARATVAWIRERLRDGQGFDVVHLHDFAGAPVAAALGADSDLPIPNVLTIHDVRRQGELSARDLAVVRPLSEPDLAECFKLGSRLNLLKAGIQCTDVLTTVSTTYAEQLRTEETAGALARVIAESDPPLIGIENGVDFSTYNPATDPALVSHYTAEDVANKERCKTALIRQAGLELETDRPLVTASGELTREHGFDLVADAAASLLRGYVTFVVAGTPGPGTKRKLAAARKHFPDTFALIESVDDTLARRLMAGADLVLCADETQPFYAVPLIAQRYGALPVARAVGSVRDTLVDCDAALETGTGFAFRERSGEALLAAVQRGLAALRSPAWPALRRRVMRRDLGWDRPTRRYLQVYRQAAASRA
jgi:starch synthase